MHSKSSPEISGQVTPQPYVPGKSWCYGSPPVTTPFSLLHPTPALHLELSQQSCTTK